MQTKTLTIKEGLSLSLKEVLRVGLFVFLLVLSSRLKFYLPFSPVPVTFQTLVVFLSVTFLGKRAFLSAGLWVLLGLVGVPVFAAGSGPLYFLGPTGGYIIGFLVTTILLSAILDKGRGILWYIFCFSLAAVIIYFLGVIGICLSLRASLGGAITIGVLPFIYGACLKITLAGLIARLVKG